MADTSQQFTPAPRLRSYSSLFPSTIVDKTSEPIAQVVYADNDTITAIGVGDTKDVDIRVLQNSDSALLGYVYRLRSLLVNIDPDAAGDNVWTGKVFQTRIKVNPDPPTGGTDMYFPLSTVSTGVIDEQGGAWDNGRTITLGNIAIGDARYGTPISLASDPRDVLIYPENTTTRVQLINRTASTGPNVIRWHIVFDMYTVEQARSSALYWLNPVSR